MKEMLHQDRLAVLIEDGFGPFVTGLESHMPDRAAVYAVWEADGRCIAHHTINPSGSGINVSFPADPEAFLHRIRAAHAANGHDGTLSRAAFLVHSERGDPASPVVASYPLYADRNSNNPIAYLIRIIDDSTAEPELLESMELTGTAFAAVICAKEAEARHDELAGQMKELEQQLVRKKALFDMAIHIHSCNDPDQVLETLIRFLDELDPAVAYEIYLSQDQYSSIPSVKPLRFDQSEEDIRFRSFTEGRPIVGRCGTDAVFPLRGKQGVYGVIRIAIPDGKTEFETLQEITLLADTTGGAFENARLYEQSNRLVGELRLINEITQRLNQSLKLQDIYSFVSMELRTIFNAEFSCILELDKPSGKLIVRAGEPASFCGEVLASDYGFAGRVVASKEPLIVSDYRFNPAVESLWMKATNARSLLACPIVVEGTVVGVILMAHRRAHYFSYDNYKLLKTLSSHIGLAASNANLHAEVRRMVQTDRLTGLFARHYLDDQIGLFQKKDYCGSLILVDIDNFKKVNDTYGHQIGDRVLIQVSAIIRTSIREGDIASRWGGEELAIYLPQVSKEQAIKVAERIRKQVKTETSPIVSVSCGVSDWNWEDERISVESLFYRADMALYKAKHSGKNRICID